MIGTIVKALAGIFVGALVGYVVAYAGGATLSTVVLANAGNFGNVTYASLVSLAIMGVLAFFLRNRGAIGQVLAVGFAYQIALTLMQAIQSTGVVP